jgi:hypothetical protein
MPTTAPPIDLQQAIEQLQRDLRTAEDSRITSADRRVAEIRLQLADAQHALRVQQEAEAVAATEQQHAFQLASLLQLEHGISEAKTEVTTLRTMLTELPQRLSRAEYQLNQLLRSHALLNAELKN